MYKKLSRTTIPKPTILKETEIYPFIPSVTVLVFKNKKKFDTFYKRLSSNTNVTI